MQPDLSANRCARMRIEGPVRIQNPAGVCWLTCGPVSPPEPVCPAMALCTPICLLGARACMHLNNVMHLLCFQYPSFFSIAR
jgi:hypothetical protein